MMTEDEVRSAVVASEFTTGRTTYHADAEVDGDRVTEVRTSYWINSSFRPDIFGYGDSPAEATIDLSNRLGREVLIESIVEIAEAQGYDSAADWNYIANAIRRKAVK